jgi:hypothetical protein
LLNTTECFILSIDRAKLAITPYLYINGNQNDGLGTL